MHNMHSRVLLISDSCIKTASCCTFSDAKSARLFRSDSYSKTTAAVMIRQQHKDNLHWVKISLYHLYSHRTPRTQRPNTTTETQRTIRRTLVLLQEVWPGIKNKVLQVANIKKNLAQCIRLYVLDRKKTPAILYHYNKKFIILHIQPMCFITVFNCIKKIMVKCYKTQTKKITSVSKSL